MPLTKSDAFEKGKPTKVLFLLRDIMWSMGQWWKVPTEVDSKLVISVAYSTPPFMGGEALSSANMFQKAFPDKREVVVLHTTLPLSGTCQTPKRMGK